MPRQKHTPIKTDRPSPVCISVSYFLELEEKIKRYEKALQEIKEGSIKGDYYTGWSYDIANRVLE